MLYEVITDDRVADGAVNEGKRFHGPQALQGIAEHAFSGEPDVSAGEIQFPGDGDWLSLATTANHVRNNFV